MLNDWDLQRSETACGIAISEQIKTSDSSDA